MGLADVLGPPRQPLVTILDTPVSWTEVLGFGSGALCVRLVARRHLANWPIGIADSLFFILLFAQSGLYADAGLQIVFITLAAYGWWTWTHGGGPGASVLPVRGTTRTEWTWLLAAGVVGTLGITLLLSRATDSTVPFWDALTTSLSLMATYGPCRKRLESVPLADRVAWMREVHPDVTVVGAVDDTHMDVADPAVWHERYVGGRDFAAPLPEKR